ncbi:hypothetical protein SAMN06298215_1903 [Bacteroidales bacterium WCE2008]|nr:hypothetical protein SAMN06298215_1903 [Bacteroidales bacterium WCE2008]
MKKVFIAIFLCIVVSCYVFSFSIRHLPSSLNTKQILGVIGIIAFMLQALKEKTASLSRQEIISGVIACIFSVWCYYCVMVNGTDDDSYTQYIVSFAVWLGGAYGVVALMRSFHERVDLAIITKYLTIVCVAQGILALAVDNMPFMRTIVDGIVSDGNFYYKEVNRLYGLGAALDTAGIKFAVAMVLIAHQIVTNHAINSNRKYLGFYIVAFILITIMGSMIARTTMVGTGLGLFYILVRYIMPQRGGFVSGRQIRIFSVLTIIVAATILVAVRLYQADAEFRGNMRFAFEGFFNWAETGVFRTDSSDKLNAVMWIWPTDTRSWIIGTGIFGNFYYSTDIGYCRFTLYCGLVGLAIFSLFFIYNGLAVRTKFRDFNMACIMIIALTFIIWLKVATDIFLFNAILFCIDGDYDNDGNEIEPEPIEAQ